LTFSNTKFDNSCTYNYYQKDFINQGCQTYPVVIFWETECCTVFFKAIFTVLQCSLMSH